MKCERDTERLKNREGTREKVREKERLYYNKSKRWNVRHTVRKIGRPKKRERDGM